MPDYVTYMDSSDTSEGLSPNLWRNCPSEEELKYGPISGAHFYDDFTRFVPVAAGVEARVGEYNGFASTGGSVADGDEVNGTAVFSSDGDNEGASLELIQKPFQISQQEGRLWFEARFKTSTIADTKHGIFVGLIGAVVLGAGVPLTAGGLLSDDNKVGFHRLEGDGDQLDTVYRANGIAAVTVKADAAPDALVADTYVKVGFRLDPLAQDGTGTLRFFINGKELVDTKAVPDDTGTDFPADVRMSPVFAVLNATATTPGSSELDWWRCVQLHI